MKKILLSIDIAIFGSKHFPIYWLYTLDNGLEFKYTCESPHQVLSKEHLIHQARLRSVTLEGLQLVPPVEISISDDDY